MKIAFKSLMSILLIIAVVASTLIFGGVISINALTLDVSLGCYNSIEGSNLGTGTDMANKYAATRIFSREDLPNGTIIKIDQGYKYRPEGWVALDQTNTSRPSQVYGYSTVIVDDEWWGDYNYRAFNISKSNEADISTTYNDVASHFTITLPEEIEEETIRVLAIGNSFSNDAFHYAEEIAAKFGYKTEFWSLYQSGCYISKHLDNFNNKTEAYTIYRNGVQVRGSVTMNQILDECNFDYITLQQGSARSNKWSYYYTEENPYIVDLYNAIKAEQPNAKFLIHQTWGYSPAEAIANGHTGSLDHFTAIESCYNKAAELLDLPIAKSGKAIQLVKDYGFLTDDRGGENSVYADEYCHLTNRGDFIAGCVLVETIFGVDTTSKDFTSIFADSKNLTKAAHSAVTGVPILEEEEDKTENEDVVYKPRTMLRYKRTSNGYNKCLYKLPVELEPNIEYTITIATKHITSTTNLIFGLYGIDKDTSVGESTNNAFKADGALLYSSDSSGVYTFTAGTNQSRGVYKSYKFTLTEEEVLNKKFYLGYYFNRAEAVEFYISDFSIYKTDDATKQSLLNVDDFSTDNQGWCDMYGNANSSAKYVEYNPSYFNYMLYVKYTGSSDRRLGLTVPSTNTSDGIIEKNIKYTISYDYYFITRGFDYSVYPVLYGKNSDKNLNSSASYVRMLSDNPIKSGVTKFTDIIGYEQNKKNGTISYSFTISDSETLYDNYFISFYIRKDTTWTSVPEFYISNLKLTKEGSQENLLYENHYTTSVGGAYWRETYGYIKNSDRGFNNVNYVPYGTADGNIDGEVDIRDLVTAQETLTVTGFNPFLDTNIDRTINEDDIKNLRYQLLGLGIIASRVNK